MNIHPQYLTKLPQFKGDITFNEGTGFLNEFPIVNLVSYNWQGRILRLSNALPIHYMFNALTLPAPYDQGVQFPVRLNLDYQNNYLVRYPRFVICNSFDFLSINAYDVVGREYVRDKGIFFGQNNPFGGAIDNLVQFTEWLDIYPSSSIGSTLTFTYSVVQPDNTVVEKTVTTYEKHITTEKFIGTEALLIIYLGQAPFTTLFNPSPYVIADQFYSPDVRGQIPDEPDYAFSAEPSPVIGTLFDNIRSVDSWFNDRLTAIDSIIPELNRFKVIFLLPNTAIYNYQGLVSGPGIFWTQTNADDFLAVQLALVNTAATTLGGEVIQYDYDPINAMQPHLMANLKKWVTEFYGS